MELNIGINAQDRQDIASGLSKLLADSYSLYLKTHNYHWNVTGPHFGARAGLSPPPHRFSMGGAPVASSPRSKAGTTSSA